MKPEDYIEAARKWVGTPFVHKGHTMGAGVDCINMCYEAAKSVGLAPDNIMPADYSRDPDGVALMAALKKYMVPIYNKQMKPGDVLLFRFVKHPQHVGVYTGRNIIHAYSKMDKCVEHILDNRWRKRLVAVFRFREFVE